MFYMYNSTTMKNNNFKGKVMYYSNINGQEKRLEKEFDSQDDMNKYMQENDVQFPRLMQWFGMPSMWWFPSWFDDFFDQKLYSMGFTPTGTALSYDAWFDELQKKKAELEEQERAQKQQKSFLEKRLEEWKQLKEFFAKRKDTDAVAKAEEGIKDCQEQLKNCWC